MSLTLPGWDLTAEETKRQLGKPRSGVRSLVVWVAEIMSNQTMDLSRRPAGEPAVTESKRKRQVHSAVSSSEAATRSGMSMDPWASWSLEAQAQGRHSANVTIF